MSEESPSEKVQRREVSQLLMSARDYQAASYFMPYRFEVATPRGALHYFGCRHFRTPANHQFATLCNAVQAIRPTIILVEHLQELHHSAPQQARQKLLGSVADLSLEKAVTHGESELALKLGINLGAEVECPEPTDLERFKYLAKGGFSPEQIASYYIARAVSMFELWKDALDLPSLIELRRKQLALNWPWEADLLSAAAVDKFLERTFGVSLLGNNPTALTELVSPVKIETDSDYTVLNAIGAASSNFTDTTIVLRLLEIAHEHARILVVFGASHALRQERALRELLRVPSSITY